MERVVLGTQRVFILRSEGHMIGSYGSYGKDACASRQGTVGCFQGVRTQQRRGILHG